MSDFNFSTDGFEDEDPSGILDAGLGLDQTLDVGMDFMQQDLADAEPDHMHSDVIYEGQVDTASRNPAAVARIVEDSICSLLGSGCEDVILKLCGYSPIYGQNDPVPANLAQGYVRSLTYNPALRLYGDLVRNLPEESFNIDDEGILNLHLTREQYDNFIAPSLYLCKEELAEESPIVDSILAARDAMKGAALAAAQPREQAARRTADESVDVTEHFDELDGDLGVDEFQSLYKADIGINDNGLGEDFSEAPQIASPLKGVKVADFRGLQVKAVADHLYDHGMHEDLDAVASLLESQGIAKATVNNVIAILQYRALEESPAQSSGLANFNTEV